MLFCGAESVHLVQKQLTTRVLPHKIYEFDMTISGVSNGNICFIYTLHNIYQSALIVSGQVQVEVYIVD